METEQQKKGYLHPLTQIIEEIRKIFGELGFEVAIGPEMETEFYNFDALNMPADHPARDMQDTFWLKQKTKNNERQLPRTQTSSVQIRYMETHKPPFRIVVPGERVFRNEATDATHDTQFYQTEVLLVEKKTSLSELKGTLEYFFKRFFGEEAVIRFRPSFFPFVEPAFEVDMKWGDRWLEVAGAGLVHPNVFRYVNIDSNEWKGFAFALGVERLLMIKYGIDDIRLFYNGDLRFVNQF